MNKPQYLAELRRLLVFMTRADRERTVSHCGELFDLAGPEGADGLIARIGSPTRVSIRLSRSYEPGQVDFSFLDEQTADLTPPPESQSEPEPEPEPEPEAPDMVAGMPDLDIPPMVMDDLSGFEMIPQPEPEPELAEDVSSEGGGDAAPAAAGEQPPASGTEEAAPASAEAPSEPGPGQPANAAEPDVPAPAPGPRFISMPLDSDDTEPAEEEPDVLVERTVPLWLGVPLFVLSLVVLALPIGVVCLLLLPVLIAPGLALLLCTWLAAVGGLWCISYIADALMLFGLAFFILGLALIVLWCGLRLDTAIVTGFVRACRGVAHLTLGRKVTADA